MNTIRFTHIQFQNLKDYLFSFEEKEAAAYLIAGSFEDDLGIHFTVRDIVYPKPSDYIEQLDIHLEISPTFINKVIAIAERENLGVVICHSHPQSNKPAYSYSDDCGESETAKVLYDCLNGKPVASLLFGARTILGRFRSKPEEQPIALDEVRLVGRHINFLNLNTLSNKRSKIKYNLYSRQVIALGKQFQMTLDRLRIGIVGLGGTGSAVAEQLVRLGINKLVLVDNDTFEPSNLTRVYGSTFSDLKESPTKTYIATRNIKAINPQVHVECYGDVIDQTVIGRLKSCDVIFSCTDRHAPRSILNELSYQCFIPLIDVGVGLDAKRNMVESGTIRASIIAPSLPCLFCANIIRSDIISEEFLSDSEKKSRKKEGYIQGLTIGKTPSMISFTTIAASIGIHLFIDMLCDFMKSQSYNYLIDIQTLSANRLSSNIPSDCICNKRLGVGDAIPFSAP